MTGGGMSKVVKLELASVGEGFRFDADALLEQAKGQGFSNLLIIGELPDQIWVSSAANRGEALFLLERAKLQCLGWELPPHD
jgi:hypothetical protein